MSFLDERYLRKRKDIQKKSEISADSFSELTSDQINLYDSVFLKKGPQKIPMIPETFSDFILSYPINGDYNGLVLTTLSQKAMLRNKLKIDDLLGIFQESMNIFLGHLFTRLERTSGVLCEFHSPKVFQGESSHLFYQKIVQARSHLEKDTSEVIDFRAQSLFAIDSAIDAGVIPCFIEYRLNKASSGVA